MIVVVLQRHAKDAVKQRMVRIIIGVSGYPVNHVSEQEHAKDAVKQKKLNPIIGVNISRHLLQYIVEHALFVKGEMAMKIQMPKLGVQMTIINQNKNVFKIFSQNARTLNLSRTTFYHYLDLAKQQITNSNKPKRKIKSKLMLVHVITIIIFT